MSRPKLVNYYKNADILFLHLNNISAFQRVLPSKIFEYAALGKPIVAGLDGYSAIFMKKNISYATVFDPGNVDQCVKLIRNAESVKIDMDKTDLFVKEYAREKIMKKMAIHILALV